MIQQYFHLFRPQFTAFISLFARFHQHHLAPWSGCSECSYTTHSGVTLCSFDPLDTGCINNSLIFYENVGLKLQGLVQIIGFLLLFLTANQ